MPDSNSTPTTAKSDTELSQVSSDKFHTLIQQARQALNIPVVGSYVLRGGVWVWIGPDGTFLGTSDGQEAYLDTDALGSLFDGRA